MPIEIKVGPPGITISQGRTFMVTDQRGEINSHSDAGVYAIDTRFISSYHLFINREPWILVNSSQLSFYTARFYLTNPKIFAEDSVFEANTIGLTIERSVEKGIHEDFYIVNYTGKKIHFFVQLELRSDFADIFEVKSKRLVQRGRLHSEYLLAMPMGVSFTRSNSSQANNGIHAANWPWNMASTSESISLVTGLLNNW